MYTPSVEQLLSSPFSERKFERELKICEVARQILSFCHYRHAINHQYYVRPASRHAVMGARREQSSFIEIDLAYPMHWYEQVYRRGLASVSGCFILEMIEELDKKKGSHEVKAVKADDSAAILTAQHISYRACD
jgi:hypothetical protein